MLSRAAASAQRLIDTRHGVLTQAASAQVGPGSAGAKLAAQFFDALGTPGCAAPVLDPDSAASTAIRARIERNIQNSVDAPDPRAQDERDAASDAAKQAAELALPGAMIGELFKLAARSPAATSALLRRSHVNLGDARIDVLDNVFSPADAKNNDSMSLQEKQAFAQTVANVAEELLRHSDEPFAPAEPQIGTNRDRAVWMLNQLAEPHLGLYAALQDADRIKVLTMRRDAIMALTAARDTKDERASDTDLTIAAGAQSDIVALAAKTAGPDPGAVKAAVAGFEDIERTRRRMAEMATRSRGLPMKTARSSPSSEKNSASWSRTAAARSSSRSFRADCAS